MYLLRTAGKFFETCCRGQVGNPVIWPVGCLCACVLKLKNPLHGGYEKSSYSMLALSYTVSNDLYLKKIHLVPRLGIHGTKTSHPHKVSWHAQG